MRSKDEAQCTGGPNPRQTFVFPSLLRFFAVQRTGRTAIACSLLIGLSAALAWSAADTKNATIDEPTHLLSGWLADHDGDYRMEVTNPAAWKMLAALPDVRLPVRPPPNGPLSGRLGFAPDAEVLWAARTFFETPGVDGDLAIRRARAVLLAVNLLFAATAAAFAYQLAGPMAAVVAAALLGFDPTVLAHLPIIKADVATGTALLSLAWLTWHAGRRLTVARVAGLGVVSAVAVNLKFTGVLAGPIVGGLFAIRALSPAPWPAFGRVLATRPARLAAAAGTGVAIVAIVVGTIWAVYRFRYEPTPTPGVAIDMRQVFGRWQGVQASLALGRPATVAEAAAFRPGLLQRAVTAADAHRLLPQAYLAGVAQQSASVTLWQGYLDGRQYSAGDRTYYPKAVAYKTPLAELAAYAVAAVVGGFALRHGSAWSAACVGLPAVVLAASAWRTNLNIGVRSVLPFYPFAAVAAGSAAAWAWHRRPRLTGAVIVGLLGTQSAVAVAAWPDYLPFFNAAVGGPAGGAARLADSNLDWGQDVKALAEWHRAHPGVPIYADLFLSVDPVFYGLDCRWLFEPDPATGRMRVNLPDRPAVIAVSVTHLQGLYVTPLQRDALAGLAGRRPREVLHGTIYLYDYPP